MRDFKIMMRVDFTGKESMGISFNAEPRKSFYLSLFTLFNIYFTDKCKKYNSDIQTCSLDWSSLFLPFWSIGLVFFLVDINSFFLFFAPQVKKEGFLSF